MENFDEKELYSLNSMKAMEVIEINSGSKLGFIRDFVVNCEDYKIKSVIIPSQKISLFSKENVMEISWENIKKIGMDVILVDGSDLDFEKKNEL